MFGLQLLEQEAPEWAVVRGCADGSLSATVEPLSPSGLPTGKFELNIQKGYSQISVKEMVPGTELPAACPERHINSDGSFCLGLNAGEIVTKEEARQWWGKISFFLVCQRHVVKHGEWPRGRGLSHGAAAQVQIEMEKIAAEEGWLDELWDAYAYKENWLGIELPRIRKGSGMLVNQRSACPRGCQHKKGKPILRCDCLHKTALFELIRLEATRRKLEHGYIDMLIAAKQKCCGTMKNCPLQRSTNV